MMVARRQLKGFSLHPLSYSPNGASFHRRVRYEMEAAQHNPSIMIDSGLPPTQSPHLLRDGYLGPFDGSWEA